MSDESIINATLPRPKLRDAAPPEEWAIVELMGHVRLTGIICEVERFGVKLLRIDAVNSKGGAQPTQFIGGAAIYRVTPITKEAVEQEIERQQRLYRPALAYSGRPAEDDEPDHDRSED